MNKIRDLEQQEGRYGQSNPGTVRHVTSQDSLSSHSEDVNPPTNKDQYNCAHFMCTYENTKFFVIKS